MVPFESQYIGEEGEQADLDAAVVCSNPWDLAASHIALKRSWIGLQVYSKTMGENMRNVFKK